jgi:dCMP deaminase
MLTRRMSQESSNGRITREELGLRLAELYALRSTCPRSHVGAVIIKDGRVISAGYNGAPSGQPHCDDVGCQIGNHGGCIRAVHAESNAILYAAKVGASTVGTELYTSLSPCIDCAGEIVRAKINRVLFRTAYRDARGIKLLEWSGVVVECL